MNKIFIAPSSFATYSTEPLDLLEKNNFVYELNNTKRKLSKSEVPKYLQHYDAVIAGTESYSRENLIKLPNLKVISRLGVGMDNIDIEYAKKQKILICNTRTTPTLAVAELTLGLIIDLLRNISRSNALLKLGKWEKYMGELLNGKSLGILGLGSIGKKLVEITSRMNLEYFAYDINKDEEFVKKYDVKYCRMNELLTNSDIISIHLNLSKDTFHLFDDSKFKLMKKNAILLNTSRGEIINENSLIKAIDQKKIKGVGLDVFEDEPYNGPLINYNNVIMTPHIGSYAKEIRKEMEIESVKNIISMLKNE